jgi:hypothetical protein
MQVTFYLTEASANTAAGPFNISGTTSGGAANTVEIQAGVTKQQLIDGYTEEVANNITGGTVTSTGATCNTSDTWSINEIFITPTPTPTETEGGGGGAGGRYNCTPSGCAQAIDGDYGTLQECEDVCTNNPR